MTKNRKAVGVVRQRIRWIQARLDAGYTRQAVWQELRDRHGLDLTFTSFLKTLQRVRAETGIGSRRPKPDAPVPVEAAADAGVHEELAPAPQTVEDTVLEPTDAPVADVQTADTEPASEPPRKGLWGRLFKGAGK